MKGNVRLLSGANWNVQRVWGGAQEIRSRDKSTKNCGAVLFEFNLIFCSVQMWKVTKAFKVKITWEKGSRPSIQVNRADRPTLLCHEIRLSSVIFIVA